MILVTEMISIEELKKLSERMFERLVKAVVDIQKGIMVVDAEMHADQEEFLLEAGSEQNDLWGINIHPHVEGEDWIEFDSMINLRPSSGNKSRSVEDKEIMEIVHKRVQR